MNGNLASPRARWHKANQMAAYDRLPAELRRWLAQAALPWSAASALRLWQRALRETGCPRQALVRLTRAEARSLARERVAVRGPANPTGDLSDPVLCLSSAPLAKGPAPVRRPPPCLALFANTLGGSRGAKRPRRGRGGGEGRRRDERRAPVSAHSENRPNPPEEQVKKLLTSATNHLTSKDHQRLSTVDTIPPSPAAARRGAGVRYSPKAAPAP